MARKCFISFKTEDIAYKEAIQNMDLDIVHKSLDEAIDSTDEEYIMRKIREDHLSDSTVTIHLIGANNSEHRGEEQRYIKRELQASLYDGGLSSRNGILGIVLPHMIDTVYQGSYTCPHCGQAHNFVNINDDTVVKEFHVNYYIENDKCHHAEDDRFCVLVDWHTFTQNPEMHIEAAFQKRSHPIADSVTVYP